VSLARAEIAEQPDALARVVADADGAEAAAAGTAYHRSRQVTWPRDKTPNVDGRWVARAWERTCISPHSRRFAA
jgi:hypothetical protein